MSANTNNAGPINSTKGNVINAPITKDANATGQVSSLL